MAGGRHIDRHLQRMLMRGLVLPAAAAGAIVLGASTASADETPAGGAVEPAASQGLSAVEDGGTAVGGATDPAQTDGAIDPPQTVGGSSEKPPATADVTEAIAQSPDPSPAGQPSSGPGRDGEQQASDPVAAPVERAAVPVEQATAPVEQAAVPVEQAAVPVEQAAVPVEQATAPVEQVTARPEPEATPIFDQVARSVGTVDDVVAPAVDGVSEQLRSSVSEPVPPIDVSEAGDGPQLLDSTLRAATASVTATASGVEPRVPALEEAVETSLSSALDVDPALGRELVDPVASTTTSLPDRVLAPAVATAPLFTGVADGLMSELAATAAADALTSPAATLPVETTPIYDELRQPLTAAATPPAPLLQALSQPTVLPTADVLPPLLTVGYAPSGPGRTSADGGAPFTTSSALLVPWSALISEPTNYGATTASASPTTYPFAAPAVPAPAASSVGITVLGLPLFDGPGKSFGPALDAWFSEFIAWVSGLGLATDDPGGVGATDTLLTPDRHLLSQVGGLAEAVAAATGGSSQGASGSTLLLLFAVLGGALLLRADALTQLTAGTATALSGRAALVQDRPG